MSGKRGRTQSKQAMQLLSSRNKSHTCHTLHSIECLCSIERSRSFLPERRSHSLSHSQQSSNQNQPCENYDDLLFRQNRQLYLLVHKLGDDIWEIKDELKHLRSDSEKDLSMKVLE
ncbi:44803_t:CDS:2, partial [Gigaspora margarita]